MDAQNLTNIQCIRIQICIIIFQVVSVDKYNYRSMEGRGELLGPVQGSSPIFMGQAGAGFINGRKL